MDSKVSSNGESAQDALGRPESGFAAQADQSAALAVMDVGAATLGALDRAGEASSVATLPPRVRARVLQADRLIDEAQRIIDAPLDAYCPGPDATRANNRAQFRWKRAAALDRATYGDAPASVTNVQVNVAFGSLGAQTAAAQSVERDYVPKPRLRDQAEG